ncbi:Kinesin-like protein kip2 [Ordospora colligata]|uniref:Kinesin-like protein n=1 Tax=Ordospora colligata OC4 TaxID=1354746 RepID=A0A0B2UKD0_9MICR|nr:kinesin-like protein [Ordospora colligata OC4]KHN69684.1 kinesin-like protein [Ordospora colligata OC4]
MEATHKKVQVSIRIRPEPNGCGAWKSLGNTVWHVRNGRKTLYGGFMKVLENMTNTDVYELCVKDEIRKFLNDENCTVFAYGQTGSGKTHTMLGDAEHGIIKLAIKDVLDVRPVGISYLQIYNEKLFDLASNSEVHMFSVGNKNVMSNLCVQNVHAWGDVVPFIDKCERNRRLSATEFNEKSSRSHTVLQVTYTSNGQTRTLNMIDLAGSERASKSTDRRREGAFINKSLLALCTVVNNIGCGRYTGFRDSKLTRILQSSLDGRTNLVAICALSPSQSCIDESISTLKFAARLCNLELKIEEVAAPNECIAEPIAPSTSCACMKKSNTDNEKYLEQHVLENIAPVNAEPTSNGLLNYDTSNESKSDGHCDNAGVDEIFKALGFALIEDLRHKIHVLEELNKMADDRICLLEKMITDLLGKAPSRRMSEIFVLEKHRFDLQKKTLKK